ncbi:hypothetical protein Tco_0185550 [Tanacetum coccineum]
MDSNFNNKNEPWEFSLDIDDSDLQLTPVVRSSTSNPVRIIPGPAGLVQRAKLLKENVFILDPDGALMSTQEYMLKVVENVGEDADFNSGAWVSATNYVNAFGDTVTRCLGDIDNFLKKCLNSGSGASFVQRKAGKLSASGSSRLAQGSMKVRTGPGDTNIDFVSNMSHNLRHK